MFNVQAKKSSSGQMYVCIYVCMYSNSAYLTKFGLSFAVKRKYIMKH